ncbi:MAG TPA: transcriptional repressor [Candidatus Doudnabacteria bacterium]|nr:transcriptional repressor [Candidatus Doudnabacteria bacterium]
MNIQTLSNTYRPILEEVGLKTTKPRLLVLYTITKSKIPLSAQEIHSQLSNSKIDQATVYRNLQSLTDAKIIRLVNFQHDHNHYEIANNHHHHAICESCGKVVDISKCDLSQLEKSVKSISGFSSINQHSLEFFGLCANCAKKSAQ